MMFELVCLKLNSLTKSKRKVLKKKKLFEILKLCFLIFGIS